VTIILLYCLRNQENNTDEHTARHELSPKEVLKMMNENMNELNEKIVALTEEELAGVTGGKHSYIEGDDGKSNVRTGPGLDYKSIGVLYRGEDARYLHETSVDERGVVWYKIRWNGRDAWVSSMYTKKVRY
jgi:hypothetical protein